MHGRLNVKYETRSLMIRFTWWHATIPTTIPAYKKSIITYQKTVYMCACPNVYVTNQCTVCIHKCVCKIKKNISSVHAMTADMGSRGTAPLILNLGIREMLAVNITPRPLFPQERAPASME